MKPLRWKAAAAWAVVMAALAPIDFMGGDGLGISTGVFCIFAFAYYGHAMANAPDAPWNRNDKTEEEE